jgi:hypothetical protein
MQQRAILQFAGKHGYTVMRSETYPA